jgi:hypothetical protein
MRKLCTIIVGLAVWLAFASDAHAKLVEYMSQHPVPHKYGGGFCTIEVAHVHNYPPDEPRMYREQNGQLYFVGDPTPFHYEGPKFAYYGAHPVVDAEVHFDHPIYCYMKGPHYHWYQPPPQAHFQFDGGAYWYVGKFPSNYYSERPRFAVVNQVYAPMPYVRPVVDIHVAPPVVQAEVSVGGPGWSASAAFAAPAVPVIVPPVAAVPVPVPPIPVPVVPVPVPVPVPGVVGVGIGIGGPADPLGFIDGRHLHDPGRRLHGPGPGRIHDHGRRPPHSPFFAHPGPRKQGRHR